MAENYKGPLRIKKIRKSKNAAYMSSNNTRWIVTITVISFILSIAILFISSSIFEDTNTIVAFIIVLVIIFIGVLFDLIGVSVTAADETPFHAMASKKYYGAKQTIKLIRNANKVASFCNDVVGDICGVVSGTAGAMIVVKISQTPTQTVIYGAVVSALVASLTVGGKAAGKTFGIKNSNYIVYRVGSVLAFFAVKKNGKKDKIKK